MRGGVTRAGHQHRLVAARVPCGPERARHDLLAEAGAPQRRSTTTFSITAYGDADRVRLGITFRYVVAATAPSASSTNRYRPGLARICAKAALSDPSWTIGSAGCSCR